MNDDGANEEIVLTKALHKHQFIKINRTNNERTIVKLSDGPTRRSTDFHISLSYVEGEMFCGLLESSSCYRACALHHWTDGGQAVARLLVEKAGPVLAGLDRAGAALATHLLCRAAEREDALHWLSTLGGAYSNLGEHSAEFAVKAGQNALKQLVVGQQCGDLVTVIKCHLFLSHSLAQQGRLRQAVRLARAAWSLCQRPPVSLTTAQPRLLTMCAGVWARLQHERNNICIRSIACPAK